MRKIRSRWPVTSATTDPNIAAMLRLQQNRMVKQEPLYDAILKLAMGLMPKDYQTSLGSPTTSPRGPNVPIPNGPGEPPIAPPGINGPPWTRPDDPWSTPDQLRAQRRGPAAN